MHEYSNPTVTVPSQTVSSCYPIPLSLSLTLIGAWGGDVLMKRPFRIMGGVYDVQ